MRIFTTLALLAAVAIAEGRSAVDSILEQLASKDAGGRAEGARAAATVHDKKITSALGKLLTDKDQAVRQIAIESLSLRQGKDERKRAAQSLGKRLTSVVKKKEMKAEALLVVEAMHDLAHTSGLKPLLGDIPFNSDQELGEKRLMAAANVPDKKVIEELLKYLKSGRRANWRRGAAQRALQYATGERIRGGVDGWMAWWRDNKKTFDPVIAYEKRLEKADQRKAKEERKKNRDKNKNKRRGKKNKNDGA